MGTVWKGVRGVFGAVLVIGVFVMLGGGTGYMDIEEWDVANHELRTDDFKSSV